MLNKNPLLILLFSTLIVEAAYPNIKPFPGYYVDKNGDTVLCRIEFNDWNRNPKTIQVEAGNKMLTLGVADIRGFGIFGYSDYKTAKVSYHLNPIGGTSFSEQYSDSIETRDCFLKILSKGAYILYELVLPERAYYFISRNDSALSELVYRVREIEMQIEEDQQYKNQLFTFFVNEGISDKYLNSINSAPYSSSGIGSLVNILNGNQNGISTKKIATKPFSAEIFVGGVMTSFPSRFNGLYATGNKFNSSYSLAGGVNFLYSIPGNFKSLKLGLSMGYSSYNSSINKKDSIVHYYSANYYNTTNYTERLSFSGSMIQAKIYLMYFINRLSKCRVYVKGGLSYNLSIRNNPDVRSNYSAATIGIVNGNVPTYTSGQGSQIMITVQNTYPDIVAGLGVVKGMHTLEFAYLPPKEISTIDNISFKTGSMALYYYFSIFKEKDLPHK